MRLPRPYISMSVRCRVALRQLEISSPGDARKLKQRGLGVYLSELLKKLAEQLGCDVSELRLDHAPALALRKRVFRNGLHVDYVPPCDSPNDLIYRSLGAHLVKTNHHGDGAQHPDRVLIKKARRQERGPKPKRTNWPKRKMQGRSQWPKRKFH